MRRSSSTSPTLHTVLWIAIFCGGCFPTGATGGSDGGYVGFTGPTLELTVSGVHFGPMAPDPGAYVDLVTVRDGGGKPTQSSFRMAAALGSAGCSLAFDTFGTNSSAIGPGQYTVQSMQGGSTLSGTVYPTTAESFATPGGGASCTGSTCDGSAFVLTAIDAAHATGYFSGTVAADSGMGYASVVCSFWLKTRTYTP